MKSIIGRWSRIGAVSVGIGWLTVNTSWNRFHFNTTVEDVWIRSLAYDRATQCLEVRFTWKAVAQFRPVSLSLQSGVQLIPEAKRKERDKACKHCRNVTFSGEDCSRNDDLYWIQCG